MNLAEKMINHQRTISQYIEEHGSLDGFNNVDCINFVKPLTQMDLNSEIMTSKYIYEEGYYRELIHIISKELTALVINIFAIKELKMIGSCGKQNMKVEDSLKITYSDYSAIIRIEVPGAYIFQTIDFGTKELNLLKYYALRSIMCFHSSKYLVFSKTTNGEYSVSGYYYEGAQYYVCEGTKIIAVQSIIDFLEESIFKFNNGGLIEL